MPMSKSLSAVKVRKSVRHHVQSGTFWLQKRSLEKRGLLFAQALLELTVKLVQQANYLVFVQML